MAKLVIEVDGGQHYQGEAIEADGKRDRYLQIRGFIVLRYNASEVMRNIDGVVENILDTINDQIEKSPSNPPLIKRETG